MTVADKLPFYNQGVAIAMGTFDGVHCGHKAVLLSAGAFGLPVCVVTTKQNPHSHPRILSQEQCLRKFEEAGVDCAVYLDFEKIRDLSPESYLMSVKEKTNAGAFCCGYNFRFGKGASGSAQTVAEFCRREGISASVTERVGEVSSSQIRSCIERGLLGEAKEMLGENYSIDFTVTVGDERGKTLGFPTANQVFPDRYVRLKQGVYCTRCVIDGKEYDAVTDVGTRPTFNGEEYRAESHIIGFSGNLYGRNPRIEFIDYLRDEMKFSSPSQLVEQIKKDIKRASEKE